MVLTSMVYLKSKNAEPLPTPRFADVTNKSAFLSCFNVPVSQCTCTPVFYLLPYALRLIVYRHRWLDVFVRGRSYVFLHEHIHESILVCAIIAVAEQVVD